MSGVFLLAGHTTGGNIALPKSLIGTRAGLTQRHRLLMSIYDHRLGVAVAMAAVSADTVTWTEGEHL